MRALRRWLSGQRFASSTGSARNASRQTQRNGKGRRGEPWRLLRLAQISLLSRIYGRAHEVNSTLKVQKSEATTLIERIKAEIKKRSEAKAKRMLLKRTK